MCDGFKKRNVSRLEEAGCIELRLKVSLDFHIDQYAGEGPWDTPRLVRM
jgi:hypothetical protein